MAIVIKHKENKRYKEHCDDYDELRMKRKLVGDKENAKQKPRSKLSREWRKLDDDMSRKREGLIDSIRRVRKNKEWD